MRIKIVHVKKPRAYMEKEIIGHWCFEPDVRWVARDRWGNWVASGRTRKDCEKECRTHGYVPERA